MTTFSSPILPLKSPQGDGEVVIIHPRVDGGTGWTQRGGTAQGEVGEGGRGGDHPEATARSGVEIWGGVVSTTTTKSPPTQKVHLPSHTKFVWRPAFYAFFPYKKSPFEGLNLALNIFSRN